MVRFTEKIDLDHIDFSFIPSLRCNLTCSFCMYDCGPDNDRTLDIEQAFLFLQTVDWSRISSWGFYGGEVSQELALYQRFMDLIPPQVHKFTITNGSWMTDPQGMRDFMTFCAKNGLGIIVSGTEEHKRFQDAKVFRWFDGVPGIHFKDGDEIHPMGRAARPGWTCSRKCLTHPQPIRLAMFPGGHIILQNCDGVYPVIGNYRDRFDDVHARAYATRQRGCTPGVENVNDIMRRNAA